MTTALLRLKDVESKSGTPRSTIYWLVKQGRFPAPIKISERSSAWLESEIDEWIQSRIESSRGSQV